MPDGFDHVPFGDIDAMDAAVDPDRVAAVLVEPILGEAGVVVPSSDYLGALRQLCTERNVLLMVDEIQTGLGRTGRWFAFQHLGIEPDVVTMAKALGQRDAGRGVLGPGRGGRGVRARRPRQHLRRPAAGHVGGPGHPGGDGGRARARAGRGGRGPPAGRARAAARGRPRPRRGTAAGRRAGQRLRRAGLCRGAPGRPRDQRARGPTCCGSPRRCWCPTPTSTGPWPPCRGSWPGCWPPSGPATHPTVGHRRRPW